MVNIFNTELIILGGFLGTLYATDPERMVTAVKSKSMFGPRDDVQLTRGGRGLELLLAGSAQLASAPVLADPANTNQLQVEPA